MFRGAGGGDEFLVLITCTGGAARRKVAALKSTLAAAPEAFELPPGIDLSGGWIEVPQGRPIWRRSSRRIYHDQQRV